MQGFLETLTGINDAVNTFIWSKLGLWLLIATGILLTVMTKFFQVTHFGHWMKETVGSMFKKNVIGHSSDKSSISPFQALCTALAATIGTGNIAGVSAAIVIGGAGAVFWMWIAAFFGMMTNYSENVLGIYYRRRNSEGEWSGGAMYYLQDGLGGKKGMKGVGRFLAILFSIFSILASFGIGNMGQVNKIVANIESAFPIDALVNKTIYDGGVTVYSVVIGVFIMIIAAVIIIGGLNRIASFAEKVVPFMVVLFVAGSIVIIGVNYAHIGDAFSAIFTNAFKPIAAIGGGIGVVISKVVTQGFKRGVFSNEAGLGSSVMVHSNSNVREPVKQGMWGIFEVFADTIVVCTMTALVVLTSGVYNLETGTTIDGVSDATLVAKAFNSVFSFGNIGEKFVAVAMFLFAFTTVLGWSHYGSKAVEYLFGNKGKKIYKVIFVLMIISGSLMTSSLAWDISDTFNGLMMLPNLVGVITMSGLVVKITKNYIDRKLHGKKIKPMYSAFPDLQAESERVENDAVKEEIASAKK